MASRFARFQGWTKKMFGDAATGPKAEPRAKPNFVQLEDRVTPATFTVTNILDNQVDVVGGFSLRQAILAANSTPGFDRIVFNIPVSPSLPKRTDGTNYFPIVLNSTLPDLTDPAGLEIDASTQPRPVQPSPDNINETEDDIRPVVQLLPDPNPGAFPGNRGAFYITGSSNVIRGFVITGFPGSGITVASGNDNIFLGNYVNTDIEGTKAWFLDQGLAPFRRAGLANEITNNEKGTVLAGITFLGTGSGTEGAQNNTVGGLYDKGGAPLVNAAGTVIGFGGTITRTDGTIVTVTEKINRNVISGTPEYRRDLLAQRERDIAGAGAGPGIRFMDASTRNNLVQGNFIGLAAYDPRLDNADTLLDTTGQSIVGTLPVIPNHNGIEFVSGAVSNYVGNPTVSGSGSGSANVIRGNQHDGVRISPTTNFARPDQSGPRTFTYDPFTTADLTTAQFTRQAFLPRWHDAYSQNYYDGVSPAVEANGQRPQVLQLGVPNPNGTNPPVVPGIAGQVGAKVTINGRNLLGLNGVAFRGPNGTLVPAVFEVVDDGVVIATVPAGVITGPIRLFSPGGTADSPIPFNVIASPEPTIAFSSVVAPGSAKVGETVTIRGTGFLGALTVQFGQTPASVFTVVNDTAITAVVPFGATTGFITVTTPGGAASTINPFEVQTTPPPNVLSFAPAQAVPGQEITITGTGFTGARAVVFDFAGAGNGFSTSQLTVVNDTTIRVKVPLSAGVSNGPVQILGAGGNAVSAASFRILAPAPVSVSGFVAQAPGAVTPTSGPAGTRVLISGTGFTSATGVTFGGVAANRFTVLSDTSIEVFAPTGGTGNIAVSIPGSQGLSSASFTVTATGGSSVTAVTPGVRNTFVTVTGTNLLGVQFVRFNSTSPVNDATLRVDFPDIVVVNNTTIRVRVPLAATSGQLFVYTPSAPAGVAGNVTVTDSPLPTINQDRLLDPRQGVVGQTITVRGQGLLGTQQVLFTRQGGGTVAATFQVVDDRTVTVQVPGGAADGPVTVINPAGSSVSGGFDVLASPQPTLGSVAPLTGTVGQAVTITGTGFTSAQQVLVNAVPLQPGTFDAPGQFEILSDDQIRFRIPNGASTGKITVIVDGGLSAVSDETFTVLTSAAPTIDFVTPGGGRNTPVVIQGTGLLGTVSVAFNGIPSTKVVINSDRQIVATVPLNGTTGVISVTTPGGVAISSQVFQVTDSAAPLFNTQIPATAAVPSNGRPDIESDPQGPRGSRVFINGTGLNTVYRVEFTGNVNGVTAPVPAEFQQVNVNGTERLLVIVPNTAVTGPVSVFSSTKNAADAGRDVSPIPFGGKWDTSQYKASNVLDQEFVYGVQFEVLPNPRPDVDTATFDNGVAVRGSYLSIRGSGFLGTGRVEIAGTDHGAGQTLFAATGAADRNVLEYGEFVVENDNLITVKLATTGGVFDGTAAFSGDVFVYGPDGTADQKSVTSANISVGATQPLTFSVVGFNQTNVSPVPGFPQYKGAPLSRFWGSQVSIRAETGSFFGTTGVDFAGFQSPVVEISVDGSTVTTIIPGGIPIPDPPPPPPNVPAFTPQLPLDPIVRYTGGQAIASVHGGPSVQLLKTGNPTVTGIGGQAFINDQVVIVGSNLLGVTSVLFDMVDANGAASKIVVPRSELGLNDVTGGTILVTIPVGAGKNDLFYGRRIDRWFTGGYTVTTQPGNAGTSQTTITQPAPTLLTFIPRDVQTIDNRIVGNAIYDNGSKNQATARTDGDFAIDYVTDYGRFREPRDFWTDPPLNEKQGNEARGGMSERVDSFQSFETSIVFPITTFPNDFTANASTPPSVDNPPDSDAIGRIVDLNTGIRFDGVIGLPGGQFNNLPNNFQNFPLLQVVQSSIDRTTFSTALNSRPFRAYRIDYYYNPSYDPQDATADDTQIIPHAEVWLGSKVITTDFQGLGAVSFTQYRPFPNADGTFPPPPPGQFGLPNNRPLPADAVITATATDLSEPGAAGATATLGPDGTSRLSFFKEVDPSSGGISGTVINDKNQNKAVDANEVGAAGVRLDLFVDQGNGQLSARPLVSYTTGEDGTFTFTADNFFEPVDGGTGGLGLPNGTHRITITAPTGSVVEVPDTGVFNFTIQNGQVISDVNFLVFTPGPVVPPGTPPTVPPGTPPTVPGVPPIPGTGAPLPSALVTGADAGGGSTVNVYNPNGEFRFQFQAYEGGFTGGVRVATADVNGDGDVDIVTAPGPGIPGLIRVYNGRTGDVLGAFQPYEDAFVGGVYVALGDVDGDGRADLVTGTGEGGGPRVQVFRFNDGGSFDTLANFFPYEDSFRGGVLVTAGDMNGDGFADVLTGTGVGGGPRVQVFNGTNLQAGAAPLYNFFAYESTFRGGVYGSIGDVTGEGSADIITGVGVGGGPVVKVFRQGPEGLNGPTSTPNFALSLFAYDPSFRGGVRVDTLDANGDNILDIITGPGPGNPPDVRAIAFDGATPIYTVQPFDPDFLGGVFVGGKH